jgi:SAM-dependent methyltransferase
MSRTAESNELVFHEGAFERDDEADDAAFYTVDRMVPHLDKAALGVVSSIISSLVIEESPEILDLMASWDSHLAEVPKPGRVVGLGMNRNELESNPALDQHVIHDLNHDPVLPFDDETFDVVVNTVSVDYLISPVDVFSDVARVLRPGGLFLVLFSNRFFPEKVVRIWREASPEERQMLVEDLFAACGQLGPTESLVVQGRPRPASDRYAHTGLPSDPVHAVWAEKVGGGTDRPNRRPPKLDPWFVSDPAELERRKAEVGRTMRCPYCDSNLLKWAVPQTPFTEWDEEFLHVCFNDRCPYLLRGWDAMVRQGNGGFSYRLMFNPGNQRCMCLPVPSLNALRDSIVEE